MKTYLLILSMMSISVCKGQLFKIGDGGNTKFYVDSVRQYIDSFRLVYKIQNGNTEIIDRDAPPTYELADSLWLNYDETWIVYRYKPHIYNCSFDSINFYKHDSTGDEGRAIDFIGGMPLFDSVIIYEPERKRDTILILAMYSDTSRHFYTTTDYNTIIKSCDSCMYNYKLDTTYYRDYDTHWGNIYSVRELQGGYTELPSGLRVQSASPYWEHLYYIDENKKQLSKSIIIWQSQIIK